MEYITDAAEAAMIDKISINEIGIPSVVLMEKASLAVADRVDLICRDMNMSANEKNVKILAVCGMGNNGGDGVAAARILKEKGYDVDVLLAGNKDKATDEMNTQLLVAENLDVVFITQPDDNEYTVIIDALFGIGLSGNIEGIYADWIEWINCQSSIVVSVDIPSGISADTGKVLGCAVEADYTVTFGYKKRGLVLYPGTVYSGCVITEDIGFPKKAAERVNPKAYTYTKEDIAKLMPERKPRSNKGSFGKVLVIAGSAGMSGACFFAAKAAYRMGSGLVKIATATQNTDILKIKLPEAIVDSYEEGIADFVKWADVIAIGPGIGTNEGAVKLVSEILKVKDKPVVMDADALNILSKMPGAGGGFGLGSNFIITPHLKEMSRLTGAEIADIKENIAEFATKHTDGCTVVLKDARTIVSDGDRLYINTTGNSALSTGGSGDVLCGMIAGLLAQGMTGIGAAALAVCIHGYAAESYTNDKSRYAMLASDIIEELPKVLPH